MSDPLLASPMTEREREDIVFCKSCFLHRDTQVDSPVFPSVDSMERPITLIESAKPSFVLAVNPLNLNMRASSSYVRYIGR